MQYAVFVVRLEQLAGLAWRTDIELVLDAESKQSIMSLRVVGDMNFGAVFSLSKLSIVLFLLPDHSCNLL